MAGLEQIEVHSRDYLVRWVNVKQEYTISWTVQPHKKSINLGLFKHPGPLSTLHGSSTAQNPPSPTHHPDDEDRDRSETQSTAIEKLTGIGLKQVKWIGKCEADKVTQGKHEVRLGEAGNYALVFDNTFSKSISKTATIFLLTYPTTCQSQIQFGTQLQHPQSMATAMAIANNTSGLFKRSPKLKARDKESVDSLRQASINQQPAGGNITPVPEVPSLAEDPGSIHTGVLQKLRRKKHQGYARRFFCLDFTTSTLSYYRDRNSSALRGAIPLSLAAVSASSKTREISIDSGVELWHLKANNDADFTAWKDALETATRLTLEPKTPADNLHLATDGHGQGGDSAFFDEQEWARLETLLSRISGTRDAVRRLCIDTLAHPGGFPSPRLGSGSASTTPTEAPSGEDYFRQDEKRPFWKRKPSTTATQSNIFKRSVSAQLAVPLPGVEPVLRNGTPPPPSGPVVTRPGLHHEESMYDHCRALLHDLDSVVSEFSSVMVEGKIRRTTPPKSAVSRLSMQSVDSQEYFDAEDDVRVLDIHSDTDHEGFEDTAEGDEDSATSSDIGDDSVDVLKRRSGSVSSYLPPRAKTLTPLPLPTIHRRHNIAAPKIMPPSLIGFLRKNVGKDLSTISMPVSANEPLSLLQRAAEQLEYSQLLDSACKSKDTFERLMYVTAFAVSSLSNARVKERSIRKPFNPMLGETFELVREDRGFRFISEKVSHRPVQLALHAESENWTFTQSPLPSQKFWGKSSEIINEGKARLVLHGTGETYSWSSATCFLRNIIAGEKYVEPTGTMTVYNDVAGHKAVVSFKAKGMFSGRSEEVEVQTVDSHGQELSIGLSGAWTSSLQLKEPGKLGQRNAIWSAGDLVENAAKHYGMTLFGAQLNEITEVEKGKLASTDSRLRPDQIALEKGDHETAEHLKNQLEEAQRARRREMEAGNETWQPRWFTKVELGDEVVWKLRTGKESYWEERAKGAWTGVVPVLQT
ncbi:Oxysterol-binding protein 3 [Cladophialophora chaetospira]|uniref:Oxysterol-binding protein 3 n=1 Tax=Cladophialophora chaetospira TaxID=386627 RepID=A0AA38XE95_9EURO|nr:Oxysterol-binding protein 3 [Cladophialophora chaetospira]